MVGLQVAVGDVDVALFLEKGQLAVKLALGIGKPTLTRPRSPCLNLV